MRLAAIDLDGMLLHSNGTISARTEAAAGTGTARAAGIELVLDLD